MKKKTSVEQNKNIHTQEKYYLSAHLHSHRAELEIGEKRKTWDADRRQYHNGTIVTVCAIRVVDVVMGKEKAAR